MKRKHKPKKKATWRSPVPPPGGRHKDRKKEANKKWARQKSWEDE